MANLGYLAAVKESARNTPTRPNRFTPLYDESLTTNQNFQDQKPIYGNKFATYDVLRGIRTHKGDLTVLAEPNTSAMFFDMLLTKMSTTGTSPATHVFELSAAANPNSYTIDVSTGNVVSRYWGVQASKISPNWDNNELQWKVSLSAIGSFQGREIGTVNATTLTLKTDYDTRPTKGLLVGDLVRLYKSDGTTLDTTVASLNANGTDVTLADSATAFAAGDMIYLRPATIDFDLLDTFQWAKTQFCFADTAANALTAVHTPVEQGSTFEVTHSFKNDDGEQRSGSYDPASLVRNTGDISCEIKRFFDTPDDIRRMNNMEDTALVIRHFAGDANQYEVRVTYNRLVTDGDIVPTIKSDDILYSDIKYHPAYNATDGKAFSVTVINEVETV